MRCPKCSHDTYSKKWGTCTAEGCALNHSVWRYDIVPTGSGSASVTVGGTRNAPHVTKTPRISVTPSRAVGRPKKADAQTPAQRVAAHRARKKAIT